MAWVSVVLLALLPFISQTDAITACKYALINRVYKQVQLPSSAVSYLEGETTWVPLMISTDSSGIASRKYTFGSLSGNTLSASISTLSTSGANTSTTATYTTSSDTSFTITGSEGSFEVYAFKCSENMMGIFRCQAGTSGYAQFFTLARIIDSSSDIAGEIATCNKRMKNIDSYYNPVQLAHPDE